MKNIQEHYTLTAENIEICIHQFSILQAKDNQLDPTDLLRLRLSFEEVLLNLRERFGEEQVFTFSIVSRFRRIHFNISVEGVCYNPLNADEDEGSLFSEMGLQMLENIGLRLTFSYQNGVNRIGTVLRQKRKISFLKTLLLALGLGVVFGIVGTLLPEGFRETANLLLTPTYNTIIGLITMTSLPLIFLYTIGGICGCGDIQTFSKSGKKILGGMFGLMFLALLLSIGVSLVLFPPNMESASGGESVLGLLADTIFALFPQNLVQPFAEGNSIQVIFLGLFFGCGLLVLGQKTDSVTHFFRQLSDLMALLLEWFCMLIPVMLFVLITQTIWANSFGTILTAWPLILLVVGLYVFSHLVILLLVRTKSKLGDAIKPLGQMSLIAVSTGSSMSTYRYMQNVLEKGFHIDSRKIDFSLPMAVTFYSINCTIIYGSVVFYAVYALDISISPGWILRAAVLCFLFSAATPPVSGGPTVVIAMIFATLGLPASYLSVIVPLVTLTDNPTTVFRTNMIVLTLAWLNLDKPAAKKK